MEKVEREERESIILRERVLILFLILMRCNILIGYV
jgi:hypothetical protein